MRTVQASTGLCRLLAGVGGALLLAGLALIFFSYRMPGLSGALFGLSFCA